MKKGFWLGILVVLWLFSCVGKASPLDDKVNALRTAIKADPLRPDSQPALAAFPARAPWINGAAEDQALAQITDGGAGEVPDNSALMTINQILSVHSSEAVQKAAHELLEEIEAERQAKASAAAAEIAGVLKQLADVIAHSSKPSDLDGILVELQKYQNGGYAPGNEDQQRIFQQAAMAFQFATGWQDYLASMANGNIGQARNQLQSLAQNSYGITIVPRSHILELLDPPPSLAVPSAANSHSSPSPPVSTVDDILSQIKTLDQMADALKQIQALPVNPADSQKIQTLQTYLECYRDIKEGLPTSLDLRTVASLPGHEDITRMIWLAGLQAFFPSFTGKAEANEKPLDFVNRVLADAVSREDWETLKKALAAKSGVTSGEQFALYPSDLINGLNSLISALNQETAGQYSLAVASYEAALKSPNPDLPAKMIGEKLAAIKKDHPAEFDTGYQQTISPPVMQSSPFFRMPYNPGIPGYPYPTAPAPAERFLAIPGKENSPASDKGQVKNQVATPAIPSPTPISASGK